MKKIRTAAACLWLSASLAFLAGGTALAEEASGAAVQVEYADLRELVKNGNLSLSKSYSDYQQSIDDYQEMWDIMKLEQSRLEDEAEELEDLDWGGDEETSEEASMYRSNASSLKSSASRIYNTIDNMLDTRSTKSLETLADSYTISAQTLMNTHNQIRESRLAQEASVQALEASAAASGRRYEAGAITLEEYREEQDSLAAAKNTLASLKEQEASAKASFLTLLGSAGQDVAIGTIPEPDLAAIDAIDFETDKQKAINNSSNVQNVRHANASSTTEINNRFQLVAEAEGSEEASITAAYESLLASRSQYLAALSSYQGAELVYQSLERKQQAGMLSNTEYLQGIADYYAKKADKEIASMNLVQAYESYCWEVKGRA